MARISEEQYEDLVDFVSTEVGLGVSQYRTNQTNEEAYDDVIRVLEGCIEKAHVVRGIMEATGKF